jgi:hypothetical protein
MPTCIDGTTLAAPGPQSCGAGGGIVVGSDGGTVITSDAGTGTMNTMDAGRADTGAAGGRNGGGGNGTGGRSGTGGTGEPLPGADASADVPPAGTNGNGGSTMLPMADAGMPGAPMGKAGDGAVSGCACTTVDPVGPRSTSVALSSLLLATVVASRRLRRWRCERAERNDALQPQNCLKKNVINPTLKYCDEFQEASPGALHGNDRFRCLACRRAVPRRLRAIEARPPGTADPPDQ